MSREKMIEFLVWAVEEIEGVKVYSYQFQHLTDEQLSKDVEWYDYLLGK